MCFSSETIEAPDAMIVAPHHRTELVCYLSPEEVLDYDLPMDLRDDTDRVTLHDTYIDEMDMIGIGHILYAAPHEPHYAFDMYGVSAKF